MAVSRAANEEEERNLVKDSPVLLDPAVAAVTTFEPDGTTNLGALASYLMISLQTARS